jgi:endonuclease/exonuclease/phosphatase (EEP) superfamily protein YafD
MIRQIAVWLPVTVCAAWAVLRLFGLERGFPLVGVLAFTPFAAALSVVLVAVMALARQRAAAVVSALACVVLVGAVVPRALGGPSSATAAGGPELRVMTVNLALGHASPEAVVELARRERADVLSLQEVDVKGLRGLDAAGLRAVLPHRVARLGRTIHGTALYARVPLRPLPSPAGTWNATTVARAAVGGMPVELWAVHPAAPFDAQRTRAWRADFRKLPPATPDGELRILAGDFNATLDHAELRRLIDSGYRDAADQVGAGLQPTFPVGHLVPPITLDHVLADRRCGVRSVEIRGVRRSDHRAVVADLVLPS